jgi:hypothetical protein
MMINETYHFWPYLEAGLEREELHGLSHPIPKYIIQYKISKVFTIVDSLNLVLSVTISYGRTQTPILLQVSAFTK